MTDVDMRTVFAGGFGIAGLAAGSTLLMGFIPQLGGIISALSPVAGIAGVLSIVGAWKFYNKEF